ncbi:hypothetical protein BDF14DRAFT_1831926 [Spinellus fusiger]|nr:hypothetical protein BDF14DRAFT_1831926 [Spinellus fusiger]
MRLKVLIVLAILLVVMGLLGFLPLSLELYVNDKVLHFVCFCLFGMCLYFVWNLSYKRNVLLASVFLFSAAVGSECVQGLLPYRTFDMYDILANVAGGTSGILSALLIDYISATRREHRRRWGGKKEAEYQRALMEEEIDLEESALMEEEIDLEESALMQGY